MKRPSPWFLVLVPALVAIALALWAVESRPAAQRVAPLPDAANADEQKEALRAELQLDPPDPARLEPLARQLLQFDPDDVQAHTALARIDFEQTPTPWEKRDRTRVDQAAEHLAIVRRLEPAPSWRVLALEIQVRRWLRDADERSGDAAASARETRLLHNLLLDPKSGCVARAATDQHLAQLPVADLHEMLALHLLAIDEQLRVKAASADDLAATLDALGAAVRRLGDGPAQADAADTMVRAAARCQAVVTTAVPQAWLHCLETTQELMVRVQARNLGTPALYALLVEFLGRDAALEMGAARDWTPLPLGWAEIGLQVGRAQHRADAELAELHLQAAELKTLARRPTAEIAAHLLALEQSTDPRHQARRSLLLGATAYREGRMAAAASALEKAGPTPETTFRAILLLGNAYLVLRQPEKALPLYDKTATALDHAERLSAEDQGWLALFVGSPADLTCLRIKAHLEAARLPAAPVSMHEEQAARLAKALPAPGSPHRTAHLLLAVYYLSRGQRVACEQILADLWEHYPDSADVVRMQVALRTSAPPVSNEVVDRLVQDFQAKNPTDRGGQLLGAEWLLLSGRAKEALAALDSLSAGGARTEPYVNYLRAAAQMRQADFVPSLELLRHLSESGRLESPVLPLVLSLGDVPEQMVDLLADDDGLGIFTAGWQAYQQDDLTAAARSFFAATDHPCLAGIARRGLRLALFTLARQNAHQAECLSMELGVQRPADADLLLAAAYSHLLADNLGDDHLPAKEPGDLASALALWESALHGPEVGAALTRAEFWLAAGRPDLARAEANRAARLQPNNADILMLAANLVLETHDSQALADGVAHLTALRQLRRGPDVLLLQAELERRQGHVTAALVSYETLLRENRTYGPGYARLIDALEEQGAEREVSLWVPYWRRILPDDPLAAQAEMRLLLKDRQVAEARRIAEAFVRQQTALPLPAANSAGAGEATQLNVRLLLAGTFVGGRAWADAEAWCQRVLAERPSNQAARLLLGATYLGRMGESYGAERGRWRAKAKEVFGAVFAEDPGQLDAANNLARILLGEENRPERALQVLQDARTARGSRPPMSASRLPADFLDTLGLAYERLDQRERDAEMRALFESARQRYPRDPRLALHLGWACAKLHERARAEELFAEALRLTDARTANGLSAAERKAVHDDVAEARRRLAEAR